MEKNIPYLALTLMPIDDKTLTDVSVENGKVFSDGNRTLLIGWAVPAWMPTPICRRISP